MGADAASLIPGSLVLLDKVIRSIATFFLVALIAIIFANVIARYVFGNSLIWAQATGIWLFVYIVFLGIPLAHRSESHLALTLVIDWLPATGRRVVDLLIDTIVAYVTIMLCVAALHLMERIGGTNLALGLPIWLKFTFIPLGCAASLIHIFFRGLEGRWPLWHGPMAVVLGGALYVVLDAWQLVTLPATSPGLLMILVFAGGLLLGVPIAFAMLFSVFIANLGVGFLPPVAVVQNLVNGVGKFLLLAVPLFLTAGMLMNAGGLTRRLMDFAFSLVGHLRGGHGQVSVITSLLYGGISGSSYSEAALGSKLLVPQMVKHGYSAPLACAITASSSVLPNVVPPSIALLLVAAVAQLSVGSLWLAGIGPGIVIALCLMVAVYLSARWFGHKAATGRASLLEIARYALHSIPVLILAVIILGGLRVGLVTPTEAGALAVVYSLFLGLVVYREYGLKGLWEALSEAAFESALVGLLIGTAAPFVFLLIVEQVPQSVVAILTEHVHSAVALLLLANLILLLFGMFMDIGAAILVLTPLLMPLGVAIGIDPIHFGVIIVVNLMLGGLTPPVGMLAYIASSTTGTPVHQVFWALLPFIGALLVALLIIIFVPAVSIGILQFI